MCSIYNGSDIVLQAFHTCVISTFLNSPQKYFILFFNRKLIERHREVGDLLAYGDSVRKWWRKNLKEEVRLQSIYCI